MDRTFELTRDGNRILVTVTADGLVRTDVQGEIDFVNHDSAEAAVEAVEAACGGTVEIEQGHTHEHGHAHGHTHTAKG